MLSHFKPPSLARGMTLIEIAIVLVVMAVMVTLGLPAFRAWIQNTQIRSVAESVLNGYQVARNEAVRRNANVEFILDDAGLAAGNFWCVRLVNTNEDVQCKPTGEVSPNILVVPDPAGSTTMTFDGLGRVPTTPPNNRDGSAFMTRVDFDISGAGFADKRKMSVSVTSGGQIRMCDLEVTDNTDPRFCNY